MALRGGRTADFPHGMSFKEPLGFLEGVYASLSRRVDRIDQRLERIERRLDLVATP
jgi:hypothetical protein